MVSSMVESGSRETSLQRAMWILITAVGALITVSSITVAAVYHGKCPDEPEMNIYLYVTGVIGAVSVIFINVHRFCMRRGRLSCSDGSCLSSTYAVIKIASNLFVLAWLGAGTVRVFSKYNDYITGEFECDVTLFLFAFISLILEWIFLTVIVILSRVKNEMIKDSKKKENKR